MNQPAQSSKKSRLNYQIISSVVLIIILLVFLSVYTLNQKREKVYHPSPISFQTPLVQWKTYIDNKFGYEIKYLGDWITSSCGTNKFILSEFLIRPDRKVTCQSGDGPTIGIRTTPFHTEEGFIKDLDQYYLTKKEKIILSGREAIKVTAIERIEHPEVPGIVPKLIKIFVSRNGKTLELFYNEDPNDYEDIFNQMLSTFKFLNQNQNKSLIPPNWPVKTSSACNVVFPLPPRTEPYLEREQNLTWFWQFNEGRRSSFFKNSNLKFEKSSRVSYFNDKGTGSGQILGQVSVDCSSNTKNYTTRSFADYVSKGKV